jgi:hypothetical protein
MARVVLWLKIVPNRAYARRGFKDTVRAGSRRLVKLAAAIRFELVTSRRSCSRSLPRIPTHSFKCNHSPAPMLHLALERFGKQWRIASPYDWSGC